MYQLLQQGISEYIKLFPKGESITRFSILNDLAAPLTFHGFSIKYVFDGNELYRVNSERYYVNTNEYLLANPYCEGTINIDSEMMVKGICIDIDPKILSEAFSHFVTPDTPYPDISLDNFFNSEAFLENKYQANHTHLGHMLMQLAEQFNQNPFYDYHLDNNFYFSLAEQIVKDHGPIISQLYNIRVIKNNTRKDLYRKLCRGKNYIENNWKNNAITINEVAGHAALSEYHFFRLFKTTFGITPYQYLIQVRLLKAKGLLQKENDSVSAIALATGFSDVYAFSKAFKKHFGISPIAAMK